MSIRFEIRENRYSMNIDILRLYKLKKYIYRFFDGGDRRGGISFFLLFFFLFFFFLVDNYFCTFIYVFFVSMYLFQCKFHLYQNFDIRISLLQDESIFPYDIELYITPTI